MLRICSWLVMVVAVCVAPALGQSAATKQNIYQDPGGIFTVKVPLGWQAQQEQQGVSLTNEKLQARVRVEVKRTHDSSSASAETELSSIQDQLGRFCPHKNIKENGSAELAGLPAVFFIANCTENGAETVLKFAAASASGMVLIVDSAAPAANSSAIQATIDVIEHSLTLSSAATPLNASSTAGQKSGNERQLAALHKACNIGALNKEECDQKMAALTATPEPAPRSNSDQNIGPDVIAPPPKSLSPAVSNQYRDDEGRYSLTVPEGWTATPQGDGSGTLRLARGSEWAMIELRTGPDDYSAKPAGLTHAVLQELEPHYRQEHLVNEGEFDNNGHQAHGANATGVDEDGNLVAVMVVSIRARGSNYLSVVSSAPKEQSQQINDQVMTMIRSIRFGGE